MVEDRNGHEILSSEQVFAGRVIEVFVDSVMLPDGREASWERVAHPGAVGIVPVLADGTVLMVRQFRNAVGGELLEIPAGKLDNNEPPRRCAERELAEEVGMKAGELTKLAEFYNSPGFSDEYFHLYLARGLSPADGEKDADEFLEVERYGLDELLAMVSRAEITDAKSVIGIALAVMFANGEVGPFTGEALK